MVGVGPPLSYQKFILSYSIIFNENYSMLIDVVRQGLKLMQGGGSQGFALSAEVGRAVR